MQERYTEIKVPAAAYDEVRSLTELAARLYYARNKLKGRVGTGIFLVAFLRQDPQAVSCHKIAQRAIKDMDEEYHGKKP